MSIIVHQNDLPDGLQFDGSVAIDTETAGLNLYRDRLCMVQLSGGDGIAHLVKIPAGKVDAPNLKRLLADKSIEKLFHFARFDVAVLLRDLGVMATPIFCTKIASKLVRTNSEVHSLEILCAELLDVKLSKQQQCSDWAAENLTDEQLAYAAGDVLHLHDLQRALISRLQREGRHEFAAACYAFLPVRARLDLAGWRETDIFSH